MSKRLQMSDAGTSMEPYTLQEQREQSKQKRCNSLELSMKPTMDELKFIKSQLMDLKKRQQQPTLIPEEIDELDEIQWPFNIKHYLGNQHPGKSIDRKNSIRTQGSFPQRYVQQAKPLQTILSSQRCRTNSVHTLRINSIQSTGFKTIESQREYDKHSFRKYQQTVLIPKVQINLLNSEQSQKEPQNRMRQYNNSSHVRMAQNNNPQRVLLQQHAKQDHLRRQINQTQPDLMSTNQQLQFLKEQTKKLYYNIKGKTKEDLLGLDNQLNQLFDQIAQRMKQQSLKSRCKQ